MAAAVEGRVDGAAELGGAGVVGDGGRGGELVVTCLFKSRS